jgi:hypothetical protein
MFCGGCFHSSEALRQRAVLAVKLERPEEVGARFYSALHCLCTQPRVLVAVSEV